MIFFMVDIAQLRAGSEITFNLYLFFPLNQHIMLWRNIGETLGKELLNKYATRGLTRIWVHKSQRKAFEKYLNPHLTEEKPIEKSQETLTESGQEPDELEAQSELKTQQSPDEPSGPAPKTEEGALISEIMNSPELKEEEKKEVVAQAAQQILAEAAHASTPEEQDEANKKLSQIVEDVLTATSDDTQSAIAEIWRMANVDPELKHSVNVATYSVVFAMAFGRIAPDLISDLAMAGLLHDVGLSQVPAHITLQPWSKMDIAVKKSYAEHVTQGIELIKKHSPETPQRVLEIIHQHHEKFDGSGYPRKLKGFAFDDIAQIVSMAEVMESVVSGQWDGQNRTVQQSFEVLEKIETARTFPEYFNPEVFSIVIRWLKKDEAKTAMKTATDVVGGEVKKVVNAA